MHALCSVLYAGPAVSTVLTAVSRLLASHLAKPKSDATQQRKPCMQGTCPVPLRLVTSCNILQPSQDVLRTVCLSLVHTTGWWCAG